MKSVTLVIALLIAPAVSFAVETILPANARGAVSEKPALKWEHAFVTGNGRMGALFWGAPGEETITASHCRLFLPLGTNETVPDVAASLPELRRIIKEKGHGSGMAYMVEQGRAKGYGDLMFTDPFHPGFEFKVKDAPAGQARDYRRSENFETGEVTVRWTDDRGTFERRLFVSRTDNVVVLSLRGIADGVRKAPRVNGEIFVAPVSDARVRAYIQNHKVKPDAPEAAANVLIQSTNTTTDGAIALHNVYKHGKGGYDAALRVIARGGSARAVEGQQRIAVKDADEVLVLMRIEPFKEGEAGPLAKTQKALASLPGNYDRLLKPHAKAHGELFRRVSVDFGGGADRALTTDELLARALKENTISPALLEKIYDGSRYVIICASGERPPNLQGIWSGTWQPAWSGDYTTNTNLQLAIAHTLSAGTPELLHGFFDLMEEFLPDWRLNAKNFYGARGIMAPTRQSNHGRMIHWSRGFQGSFWTCGAGWMAHWYWDYYLYTGDRTFLARRAVPFLEECALFYEDFLFLDESGRYRFSPSKSAENGTADNSTQDIMVAREVLTNLIAAYRELGREKSADTAARIAKYQDILAKLPPYVVNDKGELQEWSIPGQPNKNNHRHMSHLYALFQSYEFDPVRDPEMWKASEVAYEARLNTWYRNPENVGARKNNETSSHGRMHLGLIAARLGRGEDIWEILTRMAAYNAIYPSMATAHYEKGAIFNMDANGGIPEVLNNALVFALPGQLDLLPALPKAMASGEIRGLLARGQLKLNRLAWSPGSIEVEIVSAKDQTIALRVPKAATLSSCQVVAGKAKLSDGAAPNTRTLQLSAKKPVTLRITTP
jgi:alpha-L-fucosidase 2